MVRTSIMKILCGAISLMFLSSTPAPTALNFVVKPDAGTVEFLAVGKPGFLRINGKKAALNGRAQFEDGRLSGKFEVALNQYETGIELRDEHMKKKYLETDKYPVATLEVKNMSLPSKDATGVEFSGDLTLHGVTKPLLGKADIVWTNGNKDAKVNATIKFKISDFKIEIPEYLGVKVADEVTATADFLAQSKQ